MVKANAYGFGARCISREIDDIVDYFAVSSGDEFLHIKNMTSKPIILLTPIYKNITKLAKLNCEFCVSNLYQLNLFIRCAKIHKDVDFRLHIAFNTGMNRFGFDTENEVMECFCLTEKTQNISIIAIFTHFYHGKSKYFADLQSKKFLDIENYLMKSLNKNNLMFHIANTSGFVNQKDFDMIRIGLGMFLFNNDCVFELNSKIIEIKNINKGDCVGYGREFIANRKMQIAVVAIGYADGVFKNIAGRGFVLVHGIFCKILAVCMDSIIIDVSGIDVKLNDEVTLIGENNGSRIFVCDFAKWCGTIEYEIMTRISSRVKRVYIGGLHNANHNRKVSSKKAEGC